MVPEKVGSYQIILIIIIFAQNANLSDCVVSDCVVSDCVVSDCVVSDCVVSDCVVSDYRVVNFCHHQKERFAISSIHATNYLKTLRNFFYPLASSWIKHA